MSKKSEIKKVIRKYITPLYEDDLLSTRMNAGIGLGVGAPLVALDLFLTGGSMILFFSGVIAASGSRGAFKLSEYYRKKERKNAAQQSVRSNKLVFSALNEMEKKLVQAFNDVTAYPDHLPKQKAFIKTAEEVLKDVKTLSSTFTIISGGKHKLGKDHYQFILDKKSLDSGTEKPLTLTSFLEKICPETTPKNKEKQPPKPQGGFGL